MTEPGGRLAGWSAWLNADPRRADVAVALATATVASLLLVGGPFPHDLGRPDVAAAVATFVLVLLRRRWPLPLLAVAITAALAYAATWDRASTLVSAVIVLLGTACVRLERRAAIALGVAAAVALYGHSALVNQGLAPGDGRLVIGPAACAAAVGIADAIRSWRRYRDSADAQIRSTVLASEAQARQQVTEERLAIARELHDLLGHSLSVMNVQTGAAAHLLRSDPDKAEAALGAARDAGRTVLDELRELLAVLRDDRADDGAPRTALPTIGELPRLVETMRSAGLDVTTVDTGEPRPLAPAVSVGAYRITQEALTNAAKHGAGSATVATEWDDQAVSITVTNPVPASAGAGHDVPAGGHGLVGMRERAVTNGGTLDAGPTASGFRVRARLPVVRDQRGGPT